MMQPQHGRSVASIASSLRMRCVQRRFNEPTVNAELDSHAGLGWDIRGVNRFDAGIDVQMPQAFTNGGMPDLMDRVCFFTGDQSLGEENLKLK